MNNYISSLKEKSELQIMMICLGNICRSPMAAAVLANQASNIQNPKITVSSSGTGSWHVGDGPNPKSKFTWESAGYLYEHVVQQFKREMFEQQDLLIVMDNSNYKNIVELSETSKHHEKVFYLRQFDPALRDLIPEQDYMKLEVPDPYYEPISAFQEVLVMVEAAVAGLITELTARR